MISEHSDHDALAARLAAIDSEPLEDRAAGFALLHEELRERLSSGESTTNARASAGAVRA
ncbi:hypothetical protein E3T55_15900 [Cryobacterium frigoriphilum]|uniref:Uncharacterized protein n=1 Tax=Cryobacterium frigoriphilum TaxID=1259150 RepID=A0A4R8ZV09_9MICO|nr:hypothetical protein [Cryobacterium frigoriphilum]TFD46863.1 hypothetical protein E3T55_15900 [Cryobacterium frigoriphilum]